MEIYVNYLAIEVTRRCNMKCNHCLRGDAQNLDISTAVLSGIAKHIHPASVIFTGGEPSLNVPAIKRYFELAERYDTMPAAFYVATNGATSKEQMRDLALTLLESYAKMEEQDMCEVDVSVDMFHEAFRDNDNAKILSGLSFFGQGKQHSVKDDDLNWLLNTGRANKNGIGVRAPEVLRTDMDELVTDYSTEYNNIAFDTLYIAANGNVVDGCDSSYEDIEMFGLDNLFAQTSAQKFYISRDRIAEILRVSPDALDAFEKAYSKAALQTEPESIFEVNSRQAAAKNERLGDDSPEELKALTERIVKELIWQTLTYTYDGKTGKIEKSLSNAPEKNAPVTNQDLLRIPASLRPQLSGELMKRDLDITASAVFLFYYDKMQNGKTPKDRRDAQLHRTLVPGACECLPGFWILPDSGNDDSQGPPDALTADSSGLSQPNAFDHPNRR